MFLSYIFKMKLPNYYYIIVDTEKTCLENFLIDGAKMVQWC